MLGQPLRRINTFTSTLPSFEEGERHVSMRMNVLVRWCGRERTHCRVWQGVKGLRAVLLALPDMDGALPL